MDHPNNHGLAKRRKVSRACDNCKARKAKCSGTIPCNGCIAKNVSCHFLAEYRRGRPPTPRPRLAPMAGQTTAPAPVTGEGFNSEVEERVAPAPSRASPGIAVTEIQGQYVDPTSGLAFLDRAWKRLAGQQQPQAAYGKTHDYDKSQFQRQAGDKPFELEQEDPLQLPDRATAWELLEYYFDVCIATYRFIHRPSTEAWLEQIYRNQMQTIAWTHGLSNMKVSIVLTILAIATYHRGKSLGAPYMGDGVLSTKRCDKFFDAASSLADSATGYPSLESAQARLVQVLYLLHTSRMNQAWYTFGNALQIISTLCLHRRKHRSRNTAPADTPGDYISSQLRKRTFWSAYILDVYLGVIFGRPRHYHDQDIDQDLPDPVNDEDMTPQGPRGNLGRPHRDCYVESLIFHARIGRIVGTVSRQVYSIQPLLQENLLDVINEVGDDISAWKKSLPPLLGSVQPASLVPPFRRQATALRLACCHAIMHANRPLLLRINSKRRTSEVAVRHMIDCVLAAKEVLEMVDEMAHAGTLFHAFWWTHYVTFCALTVVYAWEIQRKSAATDFLSLSERSQLEGLLELAERCQLHLAQATASNSPSRRYSIILEELSQEAKCRPATLAHSLEMISEPRTSGIPPPESAEEPIAIPSGQEGPDWMGFQNIWESWQTTDWLDIDSLALGPFSGFSTSPGPWLGDAVPNEFS